MGEVIVIAILIAGIIVASLYYLGRALVEWADTKIADVFNGPEER